MHLKNDVIQVSFLTFATPPNAGPPKRVFDTLHLNHLYFTAPAPWTEPGDESHIFRETRPTLSLLTCLEVIAVLAVRNELILSQDEVA